jgi:hypothetical protein
VAYKEIQEFLMSGCGNIPGGAAAGSGGRTVAVVLAGEEALARLLESRCFSCIASFSRSFYLKNDAGRLLCFGIATLEPGPLNVLCASWFAPEALPRPGEAVRREGGRILWGGGAADVGRVKVRHSPPLPSLTGTLFPRVELFRRISARSPQGEFAPLFPCVLGGEVLPESASFLLRAGAKAVFALAAWLASPGSGLFDGVPGVAGLLGLGPGLTPSGDDVLGGAMIALTRHGRVAAAEKLHAAVRSFSGHTNEISMAHLEMAAQGQGAETLLRFSDSLAADGPTEALLSGLSRIGHSSGWDMALGAVLALYAS